MNNLSWLNDCIINGVAEEYDKSKHNFSRLHYVSYTAVAIDAMKQYNIDSPEQAYLAAVEENTSFLTNPNRAVSKGLGDTIAKITHATGLDKLAQIYTSITGMPCGCQSRQEALNKLIPYGIIENE